MGSVSKWATAVKSQSARRELSALHAIRRKCADCTCSSRKNIKYCPCDGLHSTACPLWPFRFGRRPATIRRGPLARFLDPGRMPGADAPLESCR
jgi:hypothetical protein